MIKMRKKIVKSAITTLIVILVIIGIIYLIDMNRMDNNQPVFFSTWGRNYEPEEKVTTYSQNEFQVVLSLEDKISTDALWCGTFNLIWNDLKEELAKQDIVFTPQLEIVQNLNKGTFTVDQLDEKSYYKVYGTPSLELKAQIEKAIKEKFNETSDILDDFNWADATEKDYFLYAMLKKEFEFEKEFTELPKGNFGEYKNVQYFGIDGSTDAQVRNQVEVLYYNSKDDFAIKLITKGNDEVIIGKTNVEKKEETFLNCYTTIKQKAENYRENKNLTKEDVVRIPNITFKVKEEFKEIEQKPFLFSNGETYYIEKALQTIEFDLDKKGGRIKSEAGMGVKNTSLEMVEVREFIVDSTFSIFLQEKGKELPYFAAQISNISNVQK